jgi:16S rRNA (cytosine1402-N4)-methyltransferase
MTHIPVLYTEVLQGLSIDPTGIYVDGTLGRGGHAEGVLKTLTTGRLIAFDQDEQAILEASSRLAAYADKLTVIHANFNTLKATLTHLGIAEVSGILLDLGVSSPQFDDPQRGFSYRYNARLDMRMDRRQTLDAYTVVNTYPFADLMKILQRYGEEPFAKNIARAIEARRQKQPIETTLQLVEVIKSALPSRVLSQKGHPAKQTFQALRIEVNRELEVLNEVLDQAVSLLKPGGRLVVLTFHSLEDKAVKHRFMDLADPHIPSKLPVTDVATAPYRMIKTKTKAASAEELRDNPRAHSAHCRILERIR